MESSLHYKLRSTHIQCHKAITRQILESTDLFPGEPKILEYLAEHEPCRQKDIASGCDLDKASVTGILTRMEKRGFITRSRSEENRRCVFVSMTELGHQKQDLVEEIFREVDRRAVEGLSASQIFQLSDLLDQVRENLSSLEVRDEKN